MVLWLLIGGTAFSALLNSLGIADYLGRYLLNISRSPIEIVWAMLIISGIMGCFMDGGSILMICTPIFFPVVKTLEIDPIWFGVLYTTSIVIGYVTPPFGMNLFYMKGLVPTGITLRDIWLSALPYTLIMILGLFLLVYFPIIIIYLPSLMTK